MKVTFNFISFGFENLQEGFVGKDAMSKGNYTKSFCGVGTQNLLVVGRQTLRNAQLCNLLW